MTRFNRTALKCSAATLALSLAMISGPSALAQTAAAAAPEAESIIITGSRIARPDLEGNAPVAVIGAAEIALKGAVNVEELLYDLPQVYPSIAGQSNNPGDGSALLDLRGLGAARTLVLVNGRRWVSYDVTQLVDLNTIPANLIERAEILTGGRSAVYGSDAIAGVVNFTLKQDFEGVSVDAGYRITGRGDGGTFSTNVAMGSNFADGRGNVTIYANYTKRDEIFASARPISRQTRLDDGAGGFINGGSGSVPGTRFQVGSAFTGARPAPLVAGNNLFLADGGTRRYVGANDAFNFAPDNYIQLPQERWMIGGFANYEVSDNLEVYTELTYINNRVPTQLAATPISGNFRVAANNPFIRSDVRAAFATIDANQTNTITSNGLTDAPNDGFVTLGIGRRMQEVGGRISSNERHAMRALFGARGDISADWRYDAYYSYARTSSLESQFGNVSRSRFAQAVAGCPAGSAAGCAPANIFGPGNMSGASVDFVSVDTKNSTTVTSQVFNASISNGNLFSLGLGADPVGVAFGVEWRSEDGNFSPDFILSSGDVVGFNAGTRTAGGYSTKDVFGEIVVPILADVPFFHRLEFNGAARYADFSNNVGNVFSWSAGGQWAPVEGLTFRGQFQRATRAPTVSALFLGQSEGFPTFVDYCRLPVATTNATLRASCISNGVPTALVGTPFGSGNTQIRAIFGGNPNLEAETSDTFTIGGVLQPTFAPGLSLTVDYYDINITNAILAGGVGATNVRDACFGNAATNYVPFDTSFCAVIPREPVSFDVDGLFDGNANAGFFKTRGIDFELRYGFPVGFGVMGSDESRITFRIAATRLLQFDTNPIAFIPDLLVECAGKFGSTCGAPYSKWKGSGTIGWLTGPATFQFRLNYLGAADDDGSSGDVSITSVGSHVTMDLSAGFDINETFRATFGINNLTDKDPIFIGDSNDEQGNTYPSTYDVLGRRFFVGVTAKF